LAFFYISIFEAPIKDLNLKIHSSSKYFRDANTNINSNLETLYGSMLSNSINVPTPTAMPSAQPPSQSHYDYDTNSERPVQQQPVGNPFKQQQQSPLSTTSLNANTISIRENDELVISCAVNSSKPAANVTMWVLKRPINNYHQLIRRYALADTHNEIDPNVIEHGGGMDGGPSMSPSSSAHLDDDIRRLEIADRNVGRNRDLTLRTYVTTKFVVNRMDNHKLVACLAENTVLNDKWETKRILNVLCRHFLNFGLFP
jgi:hypothetical protein